MRLWFAMPVAVATAAVGLGLFAPASAPASCVSPTLTVPGASTGKPTTEALTGLPVSTVNLRAGQPITVRGTWFFRGCNDTSSTSGCSAPSEPEPMKPARAVELTLTQNGRTWVLGTADAASPGQQYAVRWAVVVPADVGAGDATLSARTAEVHVVVSH
jgi:hypothetical protein